MGARRRSGWAIFLVVALAVAAPTGATAATVVNGGFESGALDGWHVHRLTEAGNWFAYEGTAAPIGSKRSTPADPVQPPPQGDYAAVSDEANPDTLILYQDIALEAGRSHQLSLLAYYNSYKPIAVPTPDILSIDEESLAGEKNQQFRIDVIKPEAPLESLNPDDILRTLFVTKPRDPQSMVPTRLTANLSAFAGQTVRLRIANAVHEEVFNAGVDAVSVSSAAPGGSSPGGSRHGGGPTLFSFGKFKVNRQRGIATLRVQVPGSGLLRAKGASTSVSVAHASGAKELRKPIEPITIPFAAAKTVTIHLRPTAAARTVLKQKHKLRIKVAVTYMPTGASPETASLPVLLRFLDHSSK
jgi:hypothetical protein